MEYEFISCEFYQVKAGGVFAVVTLKNDSGREEYRFVPGIERIYRSAERLFEDAKKGFPGYKTVDLVYDGKHIYEYLNLNIEDGYASINDLIDENFTPLIAMIWCEQAITFRFRDMSQEVCALFQDILLLAQEKYFEINFDE